jgi:hypothetical protein
MVYVFLMIATILFMVALRLSGTVPKVRFAMAQTREALATMSAADLTEEAKEVAVQRAAIGMFGSLASILLRTLACVGAPAALLALGIAAGLYGMEDVVRAGTDPYFIAASTAAVIAGFYLMR